MEFFKPYTIKKKWAGWFGRVFLVQFEESTFHITQKKKEAELIVQYCNGAYSLGYHQCAMDNNIREEKEDGAG